MSPLAPHRRESGSIPNFSLLSPSPKAFLSNAISSLRRPTALTPIATSTAGTKATSGFPPSPASTAHIENPIPAILDRDGLDYITQSITYPYTTYTTTLLLGDSLYSSTVAPLAPDPGWSDGAENGETSIGPDNPADANVRIAGLPTGTIAGIAVGCGISLILLLGVLYIYWLRARQFQRLHSKKGKRGRKGSSAAGGDGGGDPAPDPPPAPPAE